MKSKKSKSTDRKRKTYIEFSRRSLQEKRDCKMELGPRQPSKTMRSVYDRYFWLFEGVTVSQGSQQPPNLFLLALSLSTDSHLCNRINADAAITSPPCMPWWILQTRPLSVCWLVGCRVKCLGLNCLFLQKKLVVLYDWENFRGESFAVCIFVDGLSVFLFIFIHFAFLT